MCGIFVEARIHRDYFRRQVFAPKSAFQVVSSFTNDYNLAKIAELQLVPCVNLNELSSRLKPVILPGETFTLKIVREGKDKGQGVGYLPDGTMVVVNNAHSAIGQQVDVQVQSLLQTGAGIIVFADYKQPLAA